MLFDHLEKFSSQTEFFAHKYLLDLSAKIVEEKKKVANRERASQVIERANENKKEQHLKLERAGLWGWVKGLFS